VLLIDDIVDSGWTATVVGVALRTAGAGPVYPFALAKAVSG
jgi:ATP-dependent DNA helicase RecQ